MKKANEMDLTFCVPSGFFIPLFSNPFLNILKKVKKKRKIRKNSPAGPRVIAERL